VITPVPLRHRAYKAQSLSHSVSKSISASEREGKMFHAQIQDALQYLTNTGEQSKSSILEVEFFNKKLQAIEKKFAKFYEEYQVTNNALKVIISNFQEEHGLFIFPNSDWENIFEQTNTSILFLGTNFQIINFTTLIRDIFCVQPQDVGRSIFDFKSHISYNTLRADAMKATATSKTIEREVKNSSTGQTYSLFIKQHQTLDHRLDGYVISFVDITQRKVLEGNTPKNEREMTQKIVELEHLYAKAPMGLCVIDRDLKYIRISDSLAAINGYSVQEHIGSSLENRVSSDVNNQASKVYKRIFASGISELGLQIQGATGANLEKNNYSIVDFHPIWQDGVVFAVATYVRDVTNETKMQKRIEQQNRQKDLLIEELQHRVKNTFTIINSISVLLLDGSDDVVIYQTRLNNRLEALSQTHDLLTDTDWTSAKFSDIILNEARPYAEMLGSSVKMEGPELILGASQALSLTMAIHELMTNAVKYGALSDNQGYIMVTTSHTVSDVNAPEGTLNVRIVWKERDGPKIVCIPSHAGFGSILIKRVLEGDLKGIVTLEYQEDGLRFQVDFPILEDAGHATS
jgi:two-component system CheB/CheR fusion protein